jgi:hypothetical protein
VEPRAARSPTRLIFHHRQTIPRGKSQEMVQKTLCGHHRFSRVSRAKTKECKAIGDPDLRPRSPTNEWNQGRRKATHPRVLTTPVLIIDPTRTDAGSETFICPTRPLHAVGHYPEHRDQIAFSHSPNWSPRFRTLSWLQRRIR